MTCACPVSVCNHHRDEQWNHSHGLGVRRGWDVTNPCKKVLTSTHHLLSARISMHQWDGDAVMLFSTSCSSALWSQCRRWELLTVFMFSTQYKSIRSMSTSRINAQIEGSFIYCTYAIRYREGFCTLNGRRVSSELQTEEIKQIDIDCYCFQDFEEA